MPLVVLLLMLVVMKAASKEMTAFLDGLNLDADTRKYISDLATDVFCCRNGDYLMLQMTGMVVNLFTKRQ